MSVVMSNNFLGTAGQPFAGDSVYSIVVGDPVLVASHYGVAVRSAAGAQTIIRQAFTPTLGPRVFSRIYRISAAPSATSDILMLRTSTDTSLYSVQISNTGRLVLGRSGATTTGTATLPVGVEFRVVVTVNAAGTQLSAAVYPNISGTAPIDTFSLALSTPTSIGYSREGLITVGGLGPGVTLDLAWPQDDDESDPGLRKYVYATVDKTSFIVPELVTVNVFDENLPAGTKTYTVNFGDGTTVGPQASATFTHTYTVAGTHSITPRADVT